MEYEFYRLEDEAELDGVCAGLADKYEIDPNIVRIAAIATLLTSGGTVVVLYFAAAFLLPDKKRLEADTPDEKRIE